LHNFSGVIVTAEKGIWILISCSDALSLVTFFLGFHIVTSASGNKSDSLAGCVVMLFLLLVHCLLHRNDHVLAPAHKIGNGPVGFVFFTKTEHNFHSKYTSSGFLGGFLSTEILHQQIQML
jgi:hypothetical protein